jgi:hypothetical protein
LVVLNLSILVSPDRVEYQCRTRQTTSTARAAAHQSPEDILNNNEPEREQEERFIAVGAEQRVAVLNCRILGKDPHAAGYEPGEGE